MTYASGRLKSHRKSTPTTPRLQPINIFMLKATSRLTNIMTAEQQKRNIVIIGNTCQNICVFKEFSY